MTFYLAAIFDGKQAIKFGIAVPHCHLLVKAW
jgi:hypothetical protein